MYGSAGELGHEKLTQGLARQHRTSSQDSAGVLRTVDFLLRPLLALGEKSLIDVPTYERISAPLRMSGLANGYARNGRYVHAKGFLNT